MSLKIKSLTAEQKIAAAEELTRFIGDHLETRHGSRKFDPSESLFMSGRLDSLSTIQLILLLEERIGLDASLLNLAMIDSYDAIKQIIMGTTADR